MNLDFIYKSCPNFPNRYICPKKLFFYLQENLGDYISQIGTSVLGKPIFKLSMGSGEIKVLAWTQMHGNESNSTHAVLDLLLSLEALPELKKDLFSQIQLDVILMLNPDASEVWTRRNALDVDINRDFHKLSSKELPFLINIAKEGDYHYALNLHEQRTIFTTDSVHPATLSFLSPSENVEREITVNRKKSMAVISDIYNSLKELIPKHIGRYTDEFYPNSTGDNFMKMGIPTILFEGGHYEEDYHRKETRKFYTIALYKALTSIAKRNGDISGWEDYENIPQNKETHYDIIYRNVKLNTDFPCILDIAIQYKEVIEAGKEEISFIPMVSEVGDCSRKKGWKEVDCTDKFFKSENKFPKLDAVQNFEII